MAVEIEDMVEKLSALDPEARARVSVAIADLIDAEQAATEAMSPAVEAELRDRLADPDPSYAGDDRVAKIFGRPLNAP